MSYAPPNQYTGVAVHNAVAVVGMWLLLLMSQLLQLPIHAEWCPLLNANTTTSTINSSQEDSTTTTTVHCGLDFTLSYTLIIILTLVLHLGKDACAVDTF